MYLGMKISTVLVFAGIAIAQAGSIVSGAQLNGDSSLEIQEVREFQVYSISGQDGSLELHVFKGAVSNTQHTIVRMLAHPNIHAELELGQYQKEEINAVVNEVVELVGKFEAESYSKLNQSGKTPSIAVTQLNRIKQKIESVYDDILLPHQKKRFFEIAARLELRKTGFINSLCSGELRDQLVVSDEQVARIDKELVVLAELISQRTSALRKEIEKSLLSTLTQSQEAELASLVSLETVASKQLEVVAIQMEFDSKTIELSDAFQAKDYLRLFVEPFFELDVDGTLVAVESVTTSVQLSRTKNFDDDKLRDRCWSVYTRLLHELTNSKVVIETLGLTDSQLRVFASLQDTNHSVEAEHSSKFKPGLGDDRIEGWFIELRSKRDKLISSGLEKVERCLTDRQLDLLERLSIRHEFIKFGFTFSMLHGQLGARLAFSKDQKEKLVDVKQELLAKITETSLELETKCLRNIINCLDSKQQEQLRSSIGPELVRIRANIDLLLNQFLERTESGDQPRRISNPTNATISPIPIPAKLMPFLSVLASS